MKNKIILVLLFITSFGFSQNYPKVDTIVKTDIYKSYISKSLEMPLYVKYILVNGGGDCEREKFRFKNDVKLNIADNDNYTKSGYDRGHMANAEDFAYDCRKDELTFRYYNCLPQTHNLNAGPWKSWETEIRNISKGDSLLIICGGIWDDKKVVNGMRVPSRFFKVVYSLKQGKLLFCQIYTNKKKDSDFQSVTIGDIEKLGIKLEWKKY